MSKYSLDDVNMVPTEWVQLKHTLDELLAGSVSPPVPPALSVTPVVADAAAAAAGNWILAPRCRRCACSAWQWGYGLISIFEEAEIRTHGLRCNARVMELYTNIRLPHILTCLSKAIQSRWP